MLLISFWSTSLNMFQLAKLIVTHLDSGICRQTDKLADNGCTIQFHVGTWCHINYMPSIHAHGRKLINQKKCFHCVTLKCVGSKALDIDNGNRKLHFFVLFCPQSVATLQYNGSLEKKSWCGSGCIMFLIVVARQKSSGNMQSWEHKVNLVKLLQASLLLEAQISVREKRVKKNTEFCCLCIHCLLGNRRHFYFISSRVHKKPRKELVSL